MKDPKKLIAPAMASVDRLTFSSNGKNRIVTKEIDAAESRAIVRAS